MKRRTHTCGELNQAHIGQKVTLQGWVDKRRDLGGLIFIELRDRFGKTQLVFSPEKNQNIIEMVKKIRSEFVIEVSGKVEKRPEGNVNPNTPMGQIDVIVEELEILNEAKTTPFEILDQTNATEDLRLTYRYLDLRRPIMQKYLTVRHELYQIVRKYFCDQKFMEIETPFLMKSTPEGARDYLVPSRNYPGRFYALPQSPQTYKQILMVAGMDRYFQIVRCFRDEDLRRDRQPEFTQIDVEISFATEDLVFEIVEGLMKNIFEKILQTTVPFPLTRISYQDAFVLYGSDKPDLRFECPILTLNAIFAKSDFKSFTETLTARGVIAGLLIKGAASFSRKEIDSLVDLAKTYNAKGVIVWKHTESGLESSINKYLTPEIVNQLLKTIK